MSRRVAIIGGGPIGLEAAAHARAAGLEVVLIERNEIGSNIAAWGFVRMFTPWRLNTTPLGRAVLGDPPLLRSFECPTGREFVEQYLVPLARSELLNGCIDTGVRVLSVGREEARASDGGQPPRLRLLVCDRSGVEQIDHADVVFDCSGTYGNRRWVGPGGLPAVGETGLKSSIWYTLPDVLGADRVRFENRHTLLIGSGTSALTLLCHLADVALEASRTRVTWIVRRWGEVLTLADEDPLPQRKALAEAGLRLLARPPAWLEVIEDASVIRIDGSQGLRVWLKQPMQTIERRADEIVAAVGFRADETILDPLEARPVYATAAVTRKALEATAADPDCTRGPTPDQAETIPTAGRGVYLLGHRSFGSNSNFLLCAGHQQVRNVTALVAAIKADPRTTPVADAT